MRTRRPGFTILEVMLAIVIATTVVTVARLLFQQLVASDIRLDDAARSEGRARNGARFVEAALRHLEVATDSQRTFNGSPTSVRFTTWCQVPNGWTERCAARLEVDTLQPSRPLHIVTVKGDSIVLQGSTAGTSFRFFTDPEDHETWVAHWLGGNTAPIGMAIVAFNDTTLLRIGNHD